MKPGGGDKRRRTWHGDDALEWAKLYTLIFPPYQLPIESHAKAQEVVTNKEPLDSARHNRNGCHTRAEAAFA